MVLPDVVRLFSRGCVEMLRRGVNIATMALNEFEKEEALQRRLMIERIDSCNLGRASDCAALVRDAARLAHERFFSARFGYFEGVSRCIVFSSSLRKKAIRAARFGTSG